jgi:N-acetyl-gamma-glutamyl-phosphate reductase
MGGAGYTGGELLRILINHPFVQIEFVHSHSSAGKYIYQVHTDLIGETELKFSDHFHTDIDILFLCVGHGDAKKFFESNPSFLQKSDLIIIDLSQDFRTETEGFVYGLPELNREKIKKSKRIANPGCFATAIQLGLLPLAQSQNLKAEIHVNATTGSTGAGQSLTETSHFSYRNNNLSVYKAFTHQHLKEINQSLKQLQSTFDHEIYFLPQRGAFTRGILATLYTKTQLTIEQARDLYQKYYHNHPFTHISEVNIDLKQVVNTNKCILYLEKNGDNLLIISIIDNLTKGASGQAVQNMNLILGIDEKTGLQLKPIAF